VARLLANTSERKPALPLAPMMATVTISLGEAAPRAKTKGPLKPIAAVESADVRRNFRRFMFWLLIILEVAILQHEIDISCTYINQTFYTKSHYHLNIFLYDLS